MSQGALVPVTPGGGWRAGISALWRGVADIYHRNAALLPGFGRGKPDRLVAIPNDPWPGNPELGQAILSGAFKHGSKLLSFGRGDWLPEGADEAWLTALHSFGWLRDVDAVGNPLGTAVMRGAVADWLSVSAELQRKSPKLLWRPDVLANRLVAFLAWSGRLTEDDPQLFEDLIESIAEQGAYLGRTIGNAPPGSPMLIALAGHVAVEFCLPAQGSQAEKRQSKALKMFDLALRQQIHPDGGHVERSPQIQLELLRVLIDTRATLRAAFQPVPDSLQQSIDRMAPIVRFFRHGDGGLALFNDTNEGDASAIDAVLAQADAAGKPPRAAPHTGFERLAQKRSLILVDVGSPAQIDAHAHAGTLSFEMSVAKERLIVNCGAYVGAGSPWRRAQRATAAHSTATIDDINSSEVLGEGRIGKRARIVELKREDNEHGTWLDMRHDGYAERFRIVHQRRLFLAASGDDLRGEEALIGEGQGRFAVRFHLHPKVQASLAQDNQAVLLRLPSGTGWRLRTAGGRVSLADSVYLGRAGEMRRAIQIVIQGETGGNPTIVKWALQREGALPPVRR
jgi:uncharacterized heparinase superfamily protein